MEALISLNSHQSKAAHHIEGPLLVLAGAGSGKTRIITARITYLINLGIPPSEIVAVTFTNKAAEEMKDRIRSSAKSFVLTATFHSLCARILRESIETIGYKSAFTIYDEKDAEELLKECSSSLGASLERGEIRSYKSAISHAKNALISPQEAPNIYKNPSERFFVSLYDAYQRRLAECNALDFDDLLYLTVRLFESHNDVLSLYQQRWKYLLIDEYQDTNAAQYRLVKLLAGNHQNVFAVGDPDQSIYSWRGADIRNILDFQKDFPGAQVLTLEQNYRSTETILNASNALIQNNSARFKKNLWSELGKGDLISTYTARSESEEAEFVVKKVVELHEKRSIGFEDIAIFYRTNAQSRSFEDALLRHEVPYIIVGGISFYDRKEIKDILAYLRVVCSPYDVVAISRALLTPRRGIGQTTIKRIIELSIHHSIPIMEMLEKVSEGFFADLRLSKKQHDGVKEFIRLIRTARALHGPLADTIKYIIEESRYVSYLREEDKETFEERRENVDELIAKASEYPPETSLEEFLEELSLASTMDETALWDSSVKLMTLHNSKGLEFDVVFMVGMEEDLFPHINSRGSSDQIEEERRLCYVGMTRARKVLFMTNSSYRILWGMPKVMSPSRFMNEIPSQYIVKEGAKPKQVSFTTEEPLDKGFPPGKEVIHPTFGSGIIRRAFMSTLGVTYDVYFPHDGELRTLVAKYAKLQSAD